jgi:phage-related minor tail protein
MDEEIERLSIAVSADTRQFKRDVDGMRAELEGPFGRGVERAGALLENSLVRAIRTGRVGFDDLKSVALSVLSEIASAAIRSGIGAILGNGQQGGQGQGGLLAFATTLIGTFLGAPGRATGGPVSPGRAYMVGERGPELFVPTSSGSIATSGPARGRDVRVSIAINVPSGSAPQALERSSRQVARAVRAALARED